jgi:hypothetical protein
MTREQHERALAACLNRTELDAVTERIKGDGSLSPNDLEALRMAVTRRRKEIAALYADWQSRQTNYE